MNKTECFLALLGGCTLVFCFPYIVFRIYEFIMAVKYVLDDRVEMWYRITKLERDRRINEDIFREHLRLHKNLKINK